MGTPGSRAAVLYCNIGDVTNLAVAKGRSCLFTRVSPAGLEDIAAGLAASTGLSREHARMWLGHVGLEQPAEAIEGDPGTSSPRSVTALENGASALLDELRLSLDFYGAQEGAVPVERGRPQRPRQRHPRPAAHMEAALGLPIAVGRPSRASASSTPPAAARLTLSYGLALED